MRLKTVRRFVLHDVYKSANGGTKAVWEECVYQNIHLTIKNIVKKSRLPQVGFVFL